MANKRPHRVGPFLSPIRYSLLITSDYGFFHLEGVYAYVCCLVVLPRVDCIDCALEL